MKTEDFINVLVYDQNSKMQSSIWPIAIRLATGLIFSFLIFAIFLGVREDFNHVKTDPHVVFKFIFAVSLFGALLPVIISAMRPEADLSQHRRRFALPILVMVIGVTIQLVTSPPDYWLSGMIGRYPGSCLRNIPALAIGPLLALLILLKNGAPSQPIATGSMAGAASGGMAAFIYALHCPDDSALFVALWYSLAIGIVAAIGAFVGSFWLKW